jgi:NAD(P)H-dependent FMN reductase
MKKLITIGGSNSKNSINKTLAEYVGGLVNGVEIVNVDLNDFEMPLFSVDLEAKIGSPEGAQRLNEVIESADAFVISLAEHNGAYSVAFKNAFDWLSRINGEVWRNKPMLLLATSPGPRGGKTVLDIALGRFPFNGGNIINSLLFPSFNEHFKNGNVVNEDLFEAIQKMVVDLEKTLQ